MPSLYNCKDDGDQWRITKFDSDFNVEASYLLDASNCKCPAGHRPSCRHRSMLPKFINRNYVGTEYFFDFDRGGWVQGASKELEEQLVASEALLNQPEQEPSLTGLQEEQILMGFHQPELYEPSLAPTGLGQVSEARPSLFIETSTTAIVREGLKYLSAPPKPTIRRRV